MFKNLSVFLLVLAWVAPGWSQVQSPSGYGNKKPDFKELQPKKKPAPVVPPPSEPKKEEQKTAQPSSPPPPPPEPVKIKETKEKKEETKRKEAEKKEAKKEEKRQETKKEAKKEVKKVEKKKKEEKKEILPVVPPAVSKSAEETPVFLSPASLPLEGENNGNEQEGLMVFFNRVLEEIGIQSVDVQTAKQRQIRFLKSELTTLRINLNFAIDEQIVKDLKSEGKLVEREGFIVKAKDPISPQEKQRRTETLFAAGFAQKLRNRIQALANLIQQREKRLTP